MTDLDPAIWENETLGAAAQNENLERLTKQQLEDRSAKVEGREPREIVVENTYPGWSPDVNERTGTVSSNYQTVRFADENPNDIPVDSGRPDEDAGSIDKEIEGTPEETQDPAIEDPSDPGDGTESQPEVEGWNKPTVPADDPNSSQEGNSTQWT